MSNVILLDKLDDLTKLDNIVFDLSEDDFCVVRDIEAKFIRGITVSDEEVKEIEDIWAKYV